MDDGGNISPLVRKCRWFGTWNRVYELIEFKWVFWSIMIGERKGPVKYYGESANEGHLYMHVCVQKQTWMYRF